MLANYHTHTVRCGHAVGTEREYIECALKGGLTELGFSDHSPQFFTDGFVSNMRMLPTEAPEYVHTLRRLAEEYSDRIKINVGFEVEYFPSLFPALKKLCGEIGIDYLIMGQHYIDTEGDFWVGMPNTDGKMLARYVDRIIEGLSTGCFSYLAHPDVYNYTARDDAYSYENTRLCEAAKAFDIPLEINMLGLSGNRHYPNEDFFKIAARVGNDIVIGCDAHCPQSLSDLKAQKAAEDFAAALGLKPIETVKLKKII